MKVYQIDTSYSDMYNSIYYVKSVLITYITFDQNSIKRKGFILLIIEIVILDHK